MKIQEIKNATEEMCFLGNSFKMENLGVCDWARDYTDEQENCSETLMAQCHGSGQDAVLFSLWLRLSANQLPAGLITADGQQQNVMVYTTSYQQVEYFVF